MDYFIAFGLGCAAMGAIWYFYPSEKAALEGEIQYLRDKIVGLEAKLRAKV